MKLLNSLALILLLPTLILFACNSEDDLSNLDSNTGTTSSTTSTSDNDTNSGGTDGSNGSTENNNTDHPIFSLFSSSLEMYEDGNYMVILSTSVPNHNSPYFSSSDSRYEAYNGDNTAFHLNPNTIQEQDYTFRIPLNPSEANQKEATPMGPMGVSINGVAIFNQYAAGGAALTGEINGFDQYNGHPQNFGGYHYHVEPTFLTAYNGKSSIIGVLLDGFPVYGPEEDGEPVNNSDLDAYHGHSHATPEYPDGIYHYHVTSEDPYINGDAFFGNTGTVAQ